MRRCSGLHGVADPVYLSHFLSSALPSVAPYCAPSGVRAVAISFFQPTPWGSLWPVTPGTRLDRRVAFLRVRSARQLPSCGVEQTAQDSQLVRHWSPHLAPGERLDPLAEGAEGPPHPGRLRVAGAQQVP